MIIYGKDNLNKLLECLIIPDVAIKTTQIWFLPIYKVKMEYYG